MEGGYELGTTVMKINGDLELCKSDKASVSVCKGTLAVPVRWKDEEDGYVFLGHGKLLVDTIVETERGAFGKPVERDLDEVFLMLGGTEEVHVGLGVASDEDLKTMNVEEKTFLDRARDLLEEFGDGTTVSGSRCFGHREGLIFAFSHGEKRPDVLLVKNSKIIYTTRDLTFISNMHKSILKSGGHVVLSTPRAVVFDRLQSVHRRD
jgi:hypothetical protein